MKIALALAVSALAGMLQEKENPAFKYWSEWKVGAWAKYKMEMDQGGQKIEMESVMKLLEVSADKAVIESSGKMKMQGNEFKTPPTKQEVKKMEAEGKVPKIDKEGDEEIELGGKKIKCHWIEFSQEQAGKKMRIKAWMAKQIPGGTAKSEVTADGGEKPMMVMQAVEWGDK